MDVSKIIKILENGVKREKEELLSQLEDVFMIHQKDIYMFGNIVEILIKFFKNEKDTELKESYLDAIYFAASYKDISRVDLFPLIEVFKEVELLSIKILIIGTIGFSHNKKYLPFINSLLDSSNAEISSEAAIAKKEIEEARNVQ